MHLFYYLNNIILIFIIGFLLTLSLAISTLFNDIKSQFIHIDNIIWADLTYISILILLLFLFIYIYTGSTSNIKSFIVKSI